MREREREREYYR